MKHEVTGHFVQTDITEVLQAARPDQILRLLRDINATDPVATAQHSEAFDEKA